MANAIFFYRNGEQAIYIVSLPAPPVFILDSISFELWSLNPYGENIQYFEMKK